MEVNKTTFLSYINRARAQEQAAYSWLLNQYWPQVYGFMIQRMHDESDAEDVSLRAFSKAFDKLDTYDDSRPFATWLISIAKNLHIDDIRKENASMRKHIKDEDIDKVRKIPDEALTPEGKLISQQNLSTLLGYVRELRPDYQEMIQLRFFQELSYKEIVEATGESMSNVKVKLLRAKKLLSEIIEKNKASNS